MFPIPFNFPFRKKDGSVTSIGAAIDAGGGSYELPTASADTKGGVKIGSGLTMDGETLNASGGGGVELDTTNQKAIFGVIDNYEYFVYVDKIYVGQYIGGYEIKTNPQSSSSDAQIDIYNIQYADGEIKSSELITTVHHTGDGYDDDNIQIRYIGMTWTVTLKNPYYKTDGTAWTSPITWNYSETEDCVLLEETP